MGQKLASPECKINILTEDALVAIFSFLSIDEKLKISGVCQRWNHVVADSRLWLNINLWKHTADKQRSRSTLRRSQAKVRRSIDGTVSDEESVLCFLQRYAGPSLKIIHLELVNKDILAHLRDKCKNLRVLSFLPNEGVAAAVRFSRDLNLPQMLFIPENLKKLQLTLKGMRMKPYEKIELSNNLMNRLGQCISLRHLNLDDFFLTEHAMVSLTKRTNLRELWLTTIREDPNVLNRILSSAVDNLTCLIDFRLSISQGYMGNINEFIQLLSTKWTNLQHLGFFKGGTLCSKNVFDDMTAKLSHLQSIQLEGCIITDTTINIIATNLQTLISLELTNGYYTAQGIKYLIGHYSLKSLGLYQRQLTPSASWLHAVYDVIASLPEIKNVKLIGNRLTELYVSEFYILKPIKMDVKVQIQNSIVYRNRHSRSSFGFGRNSRHLGAALDMN